MAYSEAQKRAVKKYNEKTYDEFKIRVGNGRKEELQTWVKEHNYKSVNEFIVSVLEKETGLELKSIKDGGTSNN